LQKSLVTKDLKRSCLVTKKLGLLLKDFVLFDPKPYNQAMQDCQKHSDAGAVNFTVTEFGLFQKIAESLRVNKDDIESEVGMRRVMNLI
jgi:predicted ATP-grasp superfamily ATP-dependent carboligase